jgi:hypothetical protein
LRTGAAKNRQVRVEIGLPLPVKDDGARAPDASGERVEPDHPMPDPFRIVVAGARKNVVANQSRRRCA